MTGAVTVASSGRTAAPGGFEWRLSRDTQDARAALYLDVRGLASFRIAAEAGAAPCASLALHPDDFWSLVTGLAEARARGAETGAAVGIGERGLDPDARTLERVTEPRWVELAAGRAPAAARVARELGARARAVRIALDRAVTEGVDALAAACADAVLEAADPPAPHWPAHPAVRDAHARGARVADALRAAWGVDAGDDPEQQHAEAGAWWWLLGAAPPALGGRTPLEALRAGEDAAVLRVLGRLARGDTYA